MVLNQISCIIKLVIVKYYAAQRIVVELLLLRGTQ